MQLRARAWHDDVELRRNDTAEGDHTDGDEGVDDDEDDVEEAEEGE